jgi:coenzyme Q-binding protein COQ10
VADVKDYPSFVPWCTGARIHRNGPQEIIAELEIGFGPFRESFTSQVTLDRPRQVLVRATEGGPLEHLTNARTFTPAGDGTNVDLVVDFQFESRVHLVHLITQRYRQHPSS